MKINRFTIDVSGTNYENILEKIISGIPNGSHVLEIKGFDGVTEVATTGVINFTKDYQIGTSYILDDYPNAHAAYSFSRLSSTYNGSVVNIRRISDNTYQEFGLDVDYVDIAAINTFLNGTSGVISDVYDQSGNNRPLAAGTADGGVVGTNQPVVKIIGGVLSINSSTALHALTATLGTISTATEFTVVKDTTSKLALISAGQITTHYFGVVSKGSSTGNVNNESGTPNYRVNSVAISSPTRDSFGIAVQNSTKNVITVENLNLSTWTKYSTRYASDGIVALEDIYTKILYGKQFTASERNDIESRLSSL